MTRSLLGAVVLLALLGCGGGSHAQYTCPGAPIGTPYMLYPMPRSTDLPAGDLTFVFARVVPAEYVQLTAGDGTRLKGSDFASPPSPLPSPMATQPPGTSPNSNMGSTVRGLAPRTTYSVSVLLEPGPCNIGGFNDVSSFTTQ